MEFVQTVLFICGAISIIVGAGAIIVKVIKPYFQINNRVEKLKKHVQNAYQRMLKLDEMQKQQSKSSSALLNH